MTRRLQFPGQLPPAGTLHDFLRALEVLGAGIRPSCHAQLKRPGHAVLLHLSCSYSMWLDVFGEPLFVEHSVSGHAPGWSEHWGHRSSGGLLKCTGHIFERTPNCVWLILRKITYLA